MSSTATYQTSSTRASGGLLLAGIVGPSVFLAAMVLGLASGRTTGSAAGSGMALGSLGFLMQAVFILAGACIVAFAVGQEALTNVIKHAAGAATVVVVHYRERELELEVTSRGSAQSPGPALASGGHGLVGMRERAALFGGRINAGPQPDGYRVQALLPLDAAPAAG